MVQRELHPRSGLVADLTNRAEGRPTRPGVEAHARRRWSKRRHPRRGAGRDASASLGPGTDQRREEICDSSLSDTPAIFKSSGGPP
ncbi:hypothetical protein NDU88_006959 [Pleurodeles waltl]|uniref:Uncharacterized protein n=1 Tax=Pleurodeles waltl TaxID=8319 RepID=A0AAV7SRC7_PLEWA|nr:hypothetical protein NDU88_006959 [Pleurodeles waltl]